MDKRVTLLKSKANGSVLHYTTCLSDLEVLNLTLNYLTENKSDAVYHKVLFNKNDIVRHYSDGVINTYSVSPINNKPSLEVRYKDKIKYISIKELIAKRLPFKQRVINQFKNIFN